MARMLKLSGQGFKTTMMNILRAQMDKVTAMLKHMGNVSRELELLRKNQKETLKINTVTN